MKLRLRPLPNVSSIVLTARSEGADSGTNGVLSLATIVSICGTSTLTATTSSSHPPMTNGARRMVKAARRASREGPGGAAVMGRFSRFPGLLRLRPW